MHHARGSLARLRVEDPAAAAAAVEELWAQLAREEPRMFAALWRRANRRAMPAAESVQVPRVEWIDEAAPVDVPAVEPVVEIPAVHVPAVEVAAVEVPAVQVPAAEAPVVVELPAVEAPAAEVPAIQVPAAEAPAVVELPAVEVAAQRVALSPARLPKVDLALPIMVNPSPELVPAEVAAAELTTADLPLPDLGPVEMSVATDVLPSEDLASF